MASVLTVFVFGICGFFVLPFLFVSRKKTPTYTLKRGSIGVCERYFSPGEKTQKYTNTVW